MTGDPTDGPWTSDADINAKIDALISAADERLKDELAVANGTEAGRVYTPDMERDLYDGYHAGIRRAFEWYKHNDVDSLHRTYTACSEVCEQYKSMAPLALTGLVHWNGLAKDVFHQRFVAPFPAVPRNQAMIANALATATSSYRSLVYRARRDAVTLAQQAIDSLKRTDSSQLGNLLALASAIVTGVLTITAPPVGIAVEAVAVTSASRAIPSLLAVGSPLAGTAATADKDQQDKSKAPIPGDDVRSILEGLYTRITANQEMFKQSEEDLRNRVTGFIGKVESALGSSAARGSMLPDAPAPDDGPSPHTGEQLPPQPGDTPENVNATYDLTDHSQMTPY